MNYWWVNQGRTYKSEVAGKFIAASKSNPEDSIPRKYKLIKEISSGDFIFSYTNKEIRALWVATSSAYDYSDDVYGSALRADVEFQ